MMQCVAYHGRCFIRLHLICKLCARSKERQEELVKAKNEETLRRLTAAKNGDASDAVTMGRKVRIFYAVLSLVQIQIRLHGC